MLINKYSVNSNLFYLLHILLWLSPIDGNHLNITIHLFLLDLESFKQGKKGV